MAIHRMTVYCSVGVSARVSRAVLHPTMCYQFRFFAAGGSQQTSLQTPSQF